MGTPLGQVDSLIVHHSASNRDSTTVAMLRAWHREREFDDIGYHWVILADGSINIGRSHLVRGAHVKGKNWNTWGVCVVGDNTKADQKWNGAQERGLLDLIKSVRTLLPRVGIYGHREVAVEATECPGLDFAAWLAVHGVKNG